MSELHPARRLWQRHEPPGGYPSGVVPVPEPIPGRAFFPGGYGLWEATPGGSLPTFPTRGVMVLGHDFHSEAGYRESLRLGAERETMPTWRNLLALLGDVGIAPRQCFFTNLFMGLRAGTATTGAFPGAADAAFVAHCQRFLLDQLSEQRPALLLTLGVHVPPVVGTLSPELSEWAIGRGLKHLDAVGAARRDVTFPGIDGLTTVAVALTHPSLRHASVRHRRFGGLAGHAAEVQMLRAAVADSQLPTSS